MKIENLQKIIAKQNRNLYACLTKLNNAMPMAHLLAPARGGQDGFVGPARLCRACPPASGGGRLPPAGHLSFVIDQGTTMNKTLFLLLSLSLLWGCMDDPFENHSLQLEAEAGVTEAWLSLHVQGLKSGAVYTLQRNGAVIFNNRLDVADTVIYDSLLTPATAYRYRFYARENGEDSPAAHAALTTMDTTSHDFTWQSYEFGGVNGSSAFYDVAVIDENDIWAVGEIHTEDTDRWNADSTIWLQPYNAAHWDGEKWELKRISPEFRGNKITPEIEGVFAFSTNDIWFCAGGAPVHWNGENYTMYNLWDLGILSQTDGGVTKIWGRSSSDIYFVGRIGTIAHYDGTSWSKVESGTELDLLDIWGTDSDNIWVCGFTEPIATVILNYNGSEWETYHYLPFNEYIEYNKNQISGPVRSIWTNRKSQLWLANYYGLYRAQNSNSTSFKRYKPLIKAWNGGTTFNIRGNDINDIMFVSDEDSFWHFNGKTFKNYPVMGNVDNLILAMAEMENGFIFVGFNFNQEAVIYMCIR